jgi:hypothetical protein
MADTAREIEDVVHAADQVIDDPVIANIAGVELDAIPDALDVEKIPSLVR